MRHYIDTWLVNHQCNILLLESIDERYLYRKNYKGTPNISEHFKNMHNARVTFLHANEFQHVEKLPPTENALTKTVLQSALNKSSRAIVQLVIEGLTTGCVKGFKEPVDLLNYLMSFECDSRTKVLLSLNTA